MKPGAPPEKPLPSIRFDAYSDFVGDVELGARALQEKALAAEKAFRPTDQRMYTRAAERLDILARKIDVRRR